MFKRLLLILILVILSVSLLYGCSGSNPTGAPSGTADQGTANPIADQFKAQGMSLVQQGNYKDAITAFNQAIPLEPQNSELYLDRGVAYDLSGDIDTAIGDYTKAIAFNSQDFTPYYLRGRDYILKGTFDPAMADLNKAIELNPNYAQAYQYRE